MTIESDLPRVLITNTVPEDVLQPLQGLAQVMLGPNDAHLMPRDEVLRLAPSLAAIINQAELRVDQELLDAAAQLRIVANVAIGYDNLDVNLMAEHGVWASNVPDAFAESTADCTLGLLLCLARGLRNADQYVRSGQWPQDGFQPGVWDGVLLDGKTLGIVGFGRIGQAVARRAQAFGLHVIFSDPHGLDDPAYRRLDALLEEADVVSLHLPLRPESRHLIDRQRLSQMKRGAYLINMARGPVVDEAALIEALQSGQIAGAGLDVFEREPQVHAALIAMDQMVLTPHIGGGTVESRRAARLLCVRNVAAVLQGTVPLTPVNRPQLR